MRSRLLAFVMTALLLVGTTGAAVAGSSASSGSNAAQSQYKPGNGCGDKNHVHTGTKCPPQTKAGAHHRKKKKAKKHVSHKKPKVTKKPSKTDSDGDHDND